MTACGILASDAAAAGDFLMRVFGSVTTGPVYVASLPNSRDDPAQIGERHVATRDQEAIKGLARKYDRAGRGLFFCVSTLRQGAVRRAKETVHELGFLHADVDAKDIEISLDDVLTAIDALPSRPSIIVHSGNGLHLYWLLKEAVDVSNEGERDRVEIALRQLADVVGGDLSVAEVSRLMRLPGTHNTKDGGEKPVTVLLADYEARHLLEDIEDMLAYMSPLVRRREAAAGRAPAATNPFLAAASRLGFKPPIDVQARLEAMSYQGAGEAAIHQTQISVSAALLNRGSPVEDVVSSVLDATRAAAGEFGERWNWVREERAVRRMCEDWVRKNPPAAQAPRAERAPAEAATASGGAVVHRLSDHRKPPPKPRKASDKAPPAHVVLAAAMIEGSAAEGRPFLSVAEASGDRQLWRYADGIWSMASSIDVEIEVAARLLGIPTSIKLRSETLAAIKADPAVVRPRADVLWDGHGMIPARNGLVDIVTLRVHPYAPEHRATWRLPFDFDATAECPSWDRAIMTFFRDKEPVEQAKYVSLIQEVAGAGLLSVKPRALSRALVLYGLENAGKSQVLNVLTGLYGKTPIAQPLKSLEGEHGTVPFTRHAPWVLHEAFNQREWILSDRVKQLITGEPIQINIKRGAQFEHIFRGPIFWGTNHPPAFREGSRAMISRMLVVPCGGGFSDTKPVEVAVEAVSAGFPSISAYVLEREGAGILRWAVEGLRRLVARQRFDTPAEMASVANEIYTDSNPLAEFVRDCCHFDPRKMVRVPDLMATFAVWFGEQRGEDLRVPSSNLVSRLMKTLPEVALMCLDRENFRKNGVRFYGGFVLNDEGMDYWRSISNSRIAGGRSSRCATEATSVNQIIPKDWFAKSADARRMVRAHEEAEALEEAAQKQATAAARSRDGPAMDVTN